MCSCKACHLIGSITGMSLTHFEPWANSHMLDNSVANQQLWRKICTSCWSPQKSVFISTGLHLCCLLTHSRCSSIHSFSLWLCHLCAIIHANGLFIMHVEYVQCGSLQSNIHFDLIRLISSLINSSVRSLLPKISETTAFKFLSCDLCRCLTPPSKRITPTQTRSQSVIGRSHSVRHQTNLINSPE